MRTKTARVRAAAAIREDLLSSLAALIDAAAPERCAKGRSAIAAEEFVDLAAAPTVRRRGRPKGTQEWIRHTGVYSAAQLAEVIASAVLYHYIHGDRDVAAVSVAESIGARLKVPEDKQASIGGHLLIFATQAGLVERYKDRAADDLWRVRLTDAAFAQLESIADRIAANAPADMSPVLAPLDSAPEVQRASDCKAAPAAPSSEALQAAEYLHRTAWRVNTWVLETIEALLPEQQRRFVRGRRRKLADTAAGVRKYARHLFAVRQARALPDPFYLRVRFDYRGRLHQIGGALTYTGGSDTARALLEFADPKPVSPEGMICLARHLINQYGDGRKVTFGDELDWINAHRALIEQTATAPLQHREWVKVDKKTRFRFLAACRAWHLAEKGEPIGLPVAIDASTSVLQHMALLLRDEATARKVNLWPGPRQDFYEMVGTECGRTALPAIEARAGVEAIPGRRKARPGRLGRPALPSDSIFKEGRDHVKRVAMTRFYGQKLKTAAERLAGEDRVGPGHWQRAERIRATTERLAPRPLQLFNSLRDIAGAFTRAALPIEWVTPSGFHVVQDRYRKSVAPVDIRVRNPEFGEFRISRRVLSDKLSGSRQQDAITANVIQSLDASLLHLAVNGAARTGVRSFATAHDSFGAHADDMSAVRSALMDALHAMYSRDVLAELWTAWAERAGADSLPPMPEHAAAVDPRMFQGQYAFC